MEEVKIEGLSTIQRRGNINTVVSIDAPDNSGANHTYLIVPQNARFYLDDAGDGETHLQIDGPDGKDPHMIQFQKGPRDEEGSIYGVADSDLLEIVRDRLQGFQRGPFSCRENALALTHIEEALLWLAHRAEDRLQRGVLGKAEP